MERMSIIDLKAVKKTLGGVEEYATVLQEFRNKIKELYNFQLSLEAFAGILGFVSDDIRNNVVPKPDNAEEWVGAMLREFTLNHESAAEVAGMTSEALANMIRLSQPCE